MNNRLSSQTELTHGAVGEAHRPGCAVAAAPVVALAEYLISHGCHLLVVVAGQQEDDDHFLCMLA
jgi:hypothetical protein